MRFLLRTITRKSQGAIAREDTVYEGERLTVGQAAGVGLRLHDLRIAGRHFDILRTNDGDFVALSLISTGIVVNDERVDTTPLKVGDKIELGDYELTVAAAEPNVDFVLEIEKVRQDPNKAIEAVQASRYSNFLHKTGYNLRTLCWTLAIGVLALFLVVPLAGYAVPGFGQLLRDYVPPLSDLVWDAGPLIRGHQHLSSDCNVCHRVPFVMANNEACLECHKTLPHHFDLNKFKLTSQQDFDCAGCHKQHQGTGTIVRQDDDLCVDCHDDIKSLATNSKLLDVTGSFPKHHPNFRATLTTNDGVKDRTFRVSLDRPDDLIDQSNLQFSHKSHLDPMLVCRGNETVCQPEEKKGLQCVSCHVPEPGGARLQPVKFEEHCHDCHKLTFEFSDPKREVPHGNAQAVLTMLTSYYLDYATNCDAPPLQGPDYTHDRRRPGIFNGAEEPIICASKAETGQRTLDPNRRQRPGADCLEQLVDAPVVTNLVDVDAPPAIRQQCQGTQVPEGVATRLTETRDWAARKAEDVRLNMLYRYRACGACHLVEGNDIRPVRVAKAWLPKAEFNHASHSAVKCDTCHGAEKSERSRDVLLKDIKTCAECHGGPNANHLVESKCVTCHGFHLSKTQKFAQASAPTTADSIKAEIVDDSAKP